MMNALCQDLADEYQALDDLVSGFDPDTWQMKTPFYGWTVFDQLAHLAFFDHQAVLAMADPEAFRQRAEQIMAVMAAGKSLSAYTNSLLPVRSGTELLGFWRENRNKMIAALGNKASQDRLCWYGPDMGAASFASARLMEGWAHSQDIYDALKITRQNRDRLFHVARMGVMTFRWSFQVNGLPIPHSRPRVDLSGPTGAAWEWGDSNAGERVWGRAEEFCLVVSQRRHPADTSLRWEGETAGQWLMIAQVFAGVPEKGPKPGQRLVD